MRWKGECTVFCAPNPGLAKAEVEFVFDKGFVL
jgi:hypothetical protein